MAGMVRPMLAIAEPSARFRLVCTRSRRAARTAARVSGSSTSRAMITPTNGVRQARRRDRRTRWSGRPPWRADHRDQRDQQQAEADQRGAGRWAASACSSVVDDLAPAWSTGRK